PRTHPHLPSFPTRRSSDLGSIELHLLDENDNTVAVMAMRDSTTREENRAVIQLGQEGNRYFLLNYNGGYRATWNDFSGVIRLERDRKSTRLNSSHVKISYA